MISFGRSSITGDLRKTTTRERGNGSRRQSRMDPRFFGCLFISGLDLLDRCLEPVEREPQADLQRSSRIGAIRRWRWMTPIAMPSRFELRRLDAKAV